MIKLRNEDNLERKELAQKFWKELKGIRTEKELTNLILRLKAEGFDLHNKSNGWGSDNYGYMELDEDRLIFTYGVYPIMGGVGKVKYVNLYKNFYIQEIR